MLNLDCTYCISIHADLSVATNPANLTCTPPQCYLCDGEVLVVCYCTAACNETISWWDNNTAKFCYDLKVSTSGNITRWLPQVFVEVIEPTECNSFSTFTSRLTYNTNVSMESSTYIQIGCFIGPYTHRLNFTSAFPTNESCSPVREPSDSERSSNSTWHIRNCTGSVYYTYCLLVVQLYIISLQHS